MKKILKRTSLLLISALMSIAAAQAQKSPQDMDRFIDALMKKMTVEEKIGQLNLPVTGDITTGQAKSSDVAQKIEKGLVGGLFNLKGVDRILEVQKLAVEKSRLGQSPTVRAETFVVLRISDAISTVHEGQITHFIEIAGAVFIF